MNDTLTVTLFVLGIIGSLAGVWLGHWLQETSQSRRSRQGAYEEIAVIALETIAQLEGIEVQLRGGPPAPSLRPELARDAFRPMVRLGITGSRLQTELEGLNAALQDATGKFAVTADGRAAQRKAAMDAVETFQSAARRELNAHWWSHQRT